MGDTETRLENLFFEAREIETPGARAAFIREACRDNEVLRRELTRLLKAHDRAGHFLNGEMRTSETAGHESETSIVEDGGSDGQIENYQLIELIGEGTFSRVYLAKQEGPVWRCVALKIIKAGMDTHEVVRRFRREREVLALMDHPGIAKIFDAGATPNGRPYFAMEWVQGTSITRYCDEHSMSIPERLALFCDVCLAVTHAHQKGVIHRDLKPSNVLVSEINGQSCPKVIDFGIVKVIRESAGGTAPGTLGASPVGTPTYMSPEQAQIGNPDVDTRSDIYSLGALLYELLSGHPPFDERSLLSATWEHVVTMIRAQDPLRMSVRLRRLPEKELEDIGAARRVPPHALCRLLEGDLDWIVLKAMEKEREARYQSVVELVEDIRHHLAHRPVSAAAPSLTYRARKLLWRNRKLVTVTCLIVGLLLGSVIVSSRLAVLARSNAEQARNSQSHAEQAEREAQRRLVEVNVAAGFAANQRSDHDQAMLWFAHAAIAAEGDPRTRAVNLLRARNWLSLNSLPVAAFEVPPGLRNLRFDPLGLRLMVLSGNGECVLWDVSRGAALPWVRQVGQILSAAWSPDGSLVALALAKGPVELRQVADGSMVARFSKSLSATAVAFSPDGRYLAHGSRRIALWDLDRGLQVAEWPHPDIVTEVIFGPESHRLATGCADGQARVLSLAPGPGQFDPVGDPLPHLPSVGTEGCKNKTTYQEDFISKVYGRSLRFLAEGGVLATRSDSYAITFREIASGRAVRQFGQICCSCNFRISPDGKAMACGMEGNVVGIWDTKTDQSGTAMLPQGGCVFDVAFHPREDMLLAAGADHSATFWSLDSGQRFGSRLHHFDDVTSVAFSPTGRIVATAEVDGLVRIWTVPETGIPGPALDYDFGPKRVRLGNRGRWVVAAKEPGWNKDFHRTRVYEVASGRPVGPPLEFQGCIQDAAVSPDGRLLAIAINDSDSNPVTSLHLLDAVTGEQIRWSSDLPSPLMSIAWHPTAARLGIVCSDGEVGVADVEPDIRFSWVRARRPAASSQRHRIQFTPDGERLVSLGSGDGWQIWRPGEDSENRQDIPAREGDIWSFTLSKSGKYLATTSVHGTVMVWDLETLQPASPVLSHPAWVYRASFSADEARLVTACHDGKVRVWEWAKGTPLGNPLVHADQVMDAAYTPDGRWIVTACHDGFVRVWDPSEGGVVMPAFKVGKQALSVVLPEDGRHVVVGSLGGALRVLPLGLLTDDRDLDLHCLRALGEILSNGEIRNGTRREFTPNEWLARFRRFQEARPIDFPSLAPEPRGEDGANTTTRPNSCRSETCASCADYPAPSHSQPH